MSNRELARSILDTIPENKLVYIIDILKGIQGFANAIEEVEPDELELQMIEKIHSDNDKDYVSFEEALKESGLTLDDLQN